MEKCVNTWTLTPGKLQFGEIMLELFFIRLSNVKNETDLAGLNMTANSFFIPERNLAF